MIEIVYKGEDEERQQEVYVKIPKNVRQIGNCEHENNKLYVEDFVMSYVKRFSSRKLKYGILLGNVKRGNGNMYVFITGVVCAKPALDNEIIFDDDVWTGLYEDVKTYFDDVEIVGWFASMPGMLKNDMPQIQKIHLDNFAGNDRVCFLIDHVESEDCFYVYDEGGMKNCGGYYIYYEKNADMQSYMVLNQEENGMMEDYEQSKKLRINSKVHKLLFQQEKNMDKGSVSDNSLEYRIQDKESGKTKINEDYNGTKKIIRRALPTFAYSASSFMLLAVLLVTVAVMNASGQLKDLKNAVSNIGKNNEVQEVNGDGPKVMDVVGGVEPTSENVSAAVEVNQTDITENVTTEKPISEQENTTTEKPISEQENTTTEKPISEQENTTAEKPISEQENTTIDEAKATVASKEQQIYIVKTGDSLYSISLKNYGNADMIESIKKANGIINENYIKEGQKIVLP
jgi:hypothetical protein